MVRIRTAMIAAAMIALMVGIWAAACYTFKLPSYLVPNPFEVLKVIWGDWAVLISHAGVTAEAALFAAVLASGLAAVVGAVIFFMPRLSSPTIISIITLQSFPAVALVPLLTIWLGNGLSPRVALGSFFAFFPQAIAVTRAVRDLDREKVEFFESLAARGSQIFWQLVVPSATPGFFAGMRIGAPLAVVGCLVSEISSSDRGLGFYMLVASRRLETAQVFAGVILAAGMGLAAYGLVVVTERFLTPWRDVLAIE